MRVDPQFLNGVVFLCVDGQHGEHVPIATGFFVSVPASPGYSYLYAVTARHVVEDADGDVLYVRANTKLGTTEDIPTSRLQWETSKVADVAAIRMDVPTVTRLQLDFSLTRLSSMVDADFRHRGEPFDRPFGVVVAGDDIVGNDGMPVDVGDDVFFVGLFVQRAGQGRMIPVARFGTIAAMPVEAIALPRFRRTTTYSGLMYLVECRSWGGHSGSPAYWAIPAIRLLENGMTSTSYAIALMGLVSAHYDIDQDAEAGGDPVVVEGKNIRVKVNSGMAVITPASEIRSLLESEAFAREREELTAKAKARQPLPRVDAVETEGPDDFTKFDFAEDLRRGGPEPE